MIRWGGPLPQTWLNFQLVLQKKILARMYDFGMTPGNLFYMIPQLFPSMIKLLDLLVMKILRASLYVILLNCILSKPIWGKRSTNLVAD